MRRTVLSLTAVLALSACSGSNNDPQAKIAELTDRLCKTMSIVGYDFSDSAIQSLDESVQSQLLADIDELRVLAPSVLDRPLTELCR
jgi:hypothetical protein